MAQYGVLNGAHISAEILNKIKRALISRHAGNFLDVEWIPRHSPLLCAVVCSLLKSDVVYGI